jgi:phage/plasmid-like protein (TIGR03299 family)
MHGLDITEGQVSFASSRSDAWHQLGQSVGHAMTARQALDEAHLGNWKVRKMPLQIPQEPVIGPDGVTTPAPLAVPDFYATVRDNPVTGQLNVLGVVGSKYEPVQNEASCELLDAITDESGAHFETAGALFGGRQTFVTMKLPKTMTLHGHNGAEDRTEFYLAALNSHGSSAFRAIVSPVRIVCANTQRVAISGAKSSFSIRHTSGARVAIQEARNALKLSWRYIDAFEAEAAALYAAAMDVDEMRDFAATLVKVGDANTVATRNRRRDQANSIVKLFVSSPTITPIAGTRWAAYNAVTEFCDHVVPVRGARTASDASATRALRSITAAGGAHCLQAKAFRMLQTL